MECVEIGAEKLNWHLKNVISPIKTSITLLPLPPPSSPSSPFAFSSICEPEPAVLLNLKKHSKFYHKNIFHYKIYIFLNPKIVSTLTHDQLFDHDPMEKESSPIDLYKDVKEDSMTPKKKNLLELPFLLPAHLYCRFIFVIVEKVTVSAKDI